MMIELEPGALFAGYTIERRLGSGGWGVVYLARDPRLPRSVALKLLDPARAGDEARRRFDREAEVTARLDHPNIVTVYDRGVEGETPWLAMQYVPGIDASALSGSDPEQVLRIGNRVADALDYAHAAGVLHRDVKPSNILLADADTGRPEQVLLGDFGIARLRDATSRLTETGSITGTAAYVSPEQISGDPVDHRSDQYSLACSLFVLLTGRPPFQVTDSLALMHAHVYTPPILPGELDPDLAVFDPVFSRALAKHPDDRFGSCAEFLAAAQDAPATAAPTRTASVPAPIARRPAPRRALLVSAAVVLVAVVGALATWAVVGREPSDDENTATPAAGTAAGWDEQHAPIAAAFPGLVGDRNANNGWNGATCSENDPGSAENGIYRDNARISCRVPMDGGSDTLTFDIQDRAGTANADLGLDDLVNGVFTGCQPRQRDLTHPTGPTLPVLTCEGIDYARDADPDSRIYMWTFFPRQSRFFMVAHWPGHTVDELTDRWWTQVPLGR